VSEVEFKKFAICDTCGVETLCREDGDDDQCGACYWAPINHAKHQSELAALREELAKRGQRIIDIADQRNEAEQRLADAERRNAMLEGEIAAALPGVRFMDLPDGGSPTLDEQVKRMSEALATAERRYEALQKLTPYRFKKMQDASVTDGGDVLYFHSDKFDALMDAELNKPEEAKS